MEPPDNNVLTVGTKVNVHINKKCTAKAEIVFVGGVHGAQRTFGEKFTVGKGKAIVKLLEVMDPTAKVPFPKANPAWKNKPTIGWVFSAEESPGKEIVVRTSNLVVPVNLLAPSSTAVSAAQTTAGRESESFLSEPASESGTVAAPSAAGTQQTPATASHPTDPLGHAGQATLSPAGKQELQMLNEFYQRYPSATDPQLKALAKEFLQKTDGKNIFPKLPSMLKANHGKWKKNCAIKMAVQDLEKHGYSAVMQQLASRMTQAGSLLLFDDSQLNATPEDPILRLNAAPLQAQQYVAPVMAPLQQEHIPIRASSDSKIRRCAWYPLCDQTSDKCGGRTRSSCKQVLEGKIAVPTSAEDLEAFRRKRLSVLAAEKQDRRKKAKTATADTED